nr:hypothetical protein [Tanacetum cinerariifolium]
MIASMLSLTDSICSGDGGTDGSSDGESGLDLLRDKDGNSDESGGYQVDDGATLLSLRSLFDESSPESGRSNMMTNGVNTLAHGVVAEKCVGRGVVMVL